MSIRKLGDSIILDFTTHSPTTGAVSDADSTPTCEVFEDDSDTAILSPTVTKRTDKTGNYRVPIAATGGNGFEVGHSYNVVVSATVGAVAAKGVIGSFTLDGKRVNDLQDVTAAQVNAEADQALADYDPPTKTELDSAVSALALEATLTAIKGSGWSTETLVVLKGLVDDLETRLTAARAGYLDELAAANIPANIDTLISRLTAARAGYLDNLSGGAAALQSSVDDLETRLTADRAGKLDNLDTTVSSRLATSGYTAPDNADIVTILGMLQHVTYGLNALLTAISTRLATSGYTPPDNAGITAIKGKTDNLPSDPADQSAVEAAITAAVSSLKGVDGDTLKTLSDQIDGIDVSGVADAVLDAMLADHTIPGSVGAGIGAAGASGDPWATGLPGAYAEGTAGAIIGGMKNLPAAVVLSAMTVAKPGLTIALDGEAGGTLSVYQGEAIQVALRITDVNRNAVDVSLATFALFAKKYFSDAEYAIEKDNDDFDKSRAADGIVMFFLSPDDTSISPGIYKTEIKIGISEASIRKGRFEININPAVEEE